jgi:sec-independent protein translocase protein TatA
MASLLALPEGGEWIILLVVVVLLFGSKKLPELTRNAARAMVEFKKVTSGKDDDDPAADPAAIAADRAVEADRTAESPAKPDSGTLPT